MDGEMRRFVDSVVEPVEKRQSTTSTTMTVAEWDTETMAACTTALETLNGVASNAAGMAVCYNLPYLDNSTGVFQADLRLFTISAPTGNFVNIPQQNVMVGLSYAGATVSAVNNSAIGVTARSEGSSLISWPRDLTEMNRRSTLPVMQQAYAFVGQINKDQLAGATRLVPQSNLPPFPPPTASYPPTNQHPLAPPSKSSSSPSSPSPQPPPPAPPSTPPSTQARPPSSRASSLSPPPRPSKPQPPSRPSSLPPTPRSSCPAPRSSFSLSAASSRASGRCCFRRLLRMGRLDACSSAISIGSGRRGLVRGIWRGYRGGPGRVWVLVEER